MLLPPSCLFLDGFARPHSLQFRVKAYLENGEELRVMGDAPSLGSLDTARAAVLATNPTE